jgi:hypothetical protein
MVKKRQSFSVRKTARERSITIMVQLEGSGRDRCSAGEAIGSLLSAGQLPHFEQVFGAPSRDGLGDCHEVAMALMVDLVTAGAAEGWMYVLGRIRRTCEVEHSWLEYDGWVVDASNATCMVVPGSEYPAVAGARRMVPDDFKAWVVAGAPGASR